MRARRRVSWNTASGPAPIDGQEKGAEGPVAFGSGGKRNHPWADWQARSSLEPSAVSNHTRPMSWLRPASSGAHPRTKGARCFTGGHRHRIPLTTKGLRVARAAWPAIGGPFADAEDIQISRTRRRRFAEKLPSGPAAGDGCARRAHGSRRRCALGVPQGMRDVGPVAEESVACQGDSRLSGCSRGETPLAHGRAPPRWGFALQCAFAFGIAAA